MRNVGFQKINNNNGNNYPFIVDEFNFGTGPEDIVGCEYTYYPFQFIYLPC